jgi:hypothetical protein
MRIRQQCRSCKTVFQEIELSGAVNQLNWLAVEELKRRTLCPKCGGWVEGREVDEVVPKGPGRCARCGHRIATITFPCPNCGHAPAANAALAGWVAGSVAGGVLGFVLWKVMETWWPTLVCILAGGFLGVLIAAWWVLRQDRQG